MNRPREKAKTPSREVSCLICGSSFLTAHSQGKYCSPECRRQGERNSWNKYGLKNKAARQAYGAAYYLENRSEVTARITAYRATEAGKKMAAAADARAKAKWPEKVAARSAVKIAIRNGSLVRQPCAVCSNPKSHAHHPDYSKPLDVEWLCPRCHATEHKLHAPFHPFTTEKPT